MYTDWWQPFGSLDRVLTRAVQGKFINVKTTMSFQMIILLFKSECDKTTHFNYFFELDIFSDLVYISLIVCKGTVSLHWQIKITDWLVITRLLSWWLKLSDGLVPRMCLRPTMTLTSIKVINSEPKKLGLAMPLPLRPLCPKDIFINCLKCLKHWCKVFRFSENKV